ncbi:polyhydroxyalkanoate synthesis repressor PhaR [Limnohabitans sp.]|jgi:polyhydroxyalkanoate synthesis repressor PhaR|uniref:polyhydroxyalkanoate synthesis repressor PhaR n=1 Tax=Limnohabitans sp. TaxID=1907725 RepID=UPI0038B8F7B2
MSSTKYIPPGEVDTRIIKKYPNRRLYDTKLSSYIALSDIKRLVMDDLRFVVLDAKTGDDLTRSLLLQIILEEETDGSPILTERMLANIIRFYGHAMQSFMGAYLEKNVQTFMDFQSQLTRTTHDQAPLNIMQGLVGQYVDQSTQALTEMQVQMQEQFKKQTDQLMDVMRLKR